MLLHPERMVKTIEISFSRFLAYMFLGGVSDRKFCKFFEFFQSGYPIPAGNLKLTYDLKVKRKYAGWEFPIKEMKEYKLEDFVYTLKGRE